MARCLRSTASRRSVGVSTLFLPALLVTVLDRLPEPLFPAGRYEALLAVTLQTPANQPALLAALLRETAPLSKLLLDRCFTAVSQLLLADEKPRGDRQIAHFLAPAVIRPPRDHVIFPAERDAGDRLVLLLLRNPAEVLPAIRREIATSEVFPRGSHK